MNNQDAHTADKIIDLDHLAELLNPIREEGKKIVHCHGVFDLLHIGHIRYFQQAQTLGDVLVVTLTPDRYVNKGPSRPIFSQNLRAEAIAALDCVDYVSINRWPMAVETIRLLKPHRYVKGSEYRYSQNDRTGGISLEEEAIKSVGGELVFTEDITFSSSRLINQAMPVFSQEVTEYLSNFRLRHSIDETIEYLDSAKKLKVLVIGETIIDEYVYCDPLGKSGKEPVLAARLINSDKFAGGTVAVANNVSSFCDEVTLLTFLGCSDSQDEFIRSSVNDNIEGIYLSLEGDAPTIVKRRFMATNPFQILFEIYEMDEGGFRPDQARLFCNKLADIITDFDLVIVTDYGHGMLEQEAIEYLCSHARFLAVTTQMNAGNRGFNTISKYSRANFICVSEDEIRLEARSQSRDLREIIVEVGNRLSCENIIITRGANGCLCYDKSEGFFEAPALATGVVDRIGAGDAVFFVAAVCAAQKAPMDVAGLIGNAAGAEAVKIVGHQSSIQRVSLSRHIETLLK